jgi:cytochrome c-type biogenesis protein CcmH/NrfG
MQTLPEDPLKIMAQIGALCSDMHVHAQALTIFQHLALLRDNHPNALVSLAMAQARSGDETAGMATLKLALESDPTHDMARVMLAIHLHKAGDLPNAQHLLQAVLGDGQDADALVLAADVKDEILNVTPSAERVSKHRYTRI